MSVATRELQMRCIERTTDSLVARYSGKETAIVRCPGAVPHDASVHLGRCTWRVIICIQPEHSLVADGRQAGILSAVRGPKRRQVRSRDTVRMKRSSGLQRMRVTVSRCPSSSLPTGCHVFVSYTRTTACSAVVDLHAVAIRSPACEAPMAMSCNGVDQQRCRGVLMG